MTVATVLFALIFVGIAFQLLLAIRANRAAR